MNSEIAGYRVTTQIGTGAGSKIYTAVELATGKMVAVKHVVRDEGKASYQGGKNVFVTLGTTQEMFGAPGAINAIKVSNNGGVVEGNIIRRVKVLPAGSGFLRTAPPRAHRLRPDGLKR